MNCAKFTFLLLLLCNHSLLSTAQAKTVILTDQGMTASYWQVPDDFTCNISIPDDPTAFCQGTGGIIYHKAFLGTDSSSASPDQLVTTLLQRVLEQSQIKILKQYTVPQITQYHLQKDSLLLFKQGQQVFAYAFDLEDPEDDRVGTAIFIVYTLPNNGAPVSQVEYYAVSAPSALVANFNLIREQYFDTLLSSQYDNNYVQATNAQHLQFLNNLRSNNNNFYARQNQIHQNNMNALDGLYNSYSRRSAASDRMQARTIDSINESQRMIDPQTGQQYQVQGGFDHNYVNPNDPSTSIQTNDALFNPNINTEQGFDFNQLEEYKD